MDDAAVARFWGHRARVTPAVTGAVAALALVTLVMVGELLSVIDQQFAYLGPRDMAGLVTLELIGVAAAAVIAVAGLHGVSWWARSAIVLAALHLAMIVAVGLVWRVRPPSLIERPLVDALPVHWLGLALGGAAVVAALVAGARRGVLTALQGVVVFALLHAVVAAVWLPLAAAWIDAHGDPTVQPFALALRGWPWMIAPPIAIAAVATVAVTVFGRRMRPAAWRAAGGALVVALLAASCVISVADGRAVILYENHGHVLIAGVLFAWGALIALAIAHLRALRAARDDANRAEPWVQRGVAQAADGEDGSIARLVFRGWLGGFATTAEAFTLRTMAGPVPVPAGARVIAPLAPWTTAASAGDARDVLRDGDQVRITGFERAGGDGPFRGSDAPVASARGLVVVVRRDAADTIRRDLVLALWRPCLLFLIASVLAALPAMAVAASRSPDDAYDPRSGYE